MDKKYIEDNKLNESVERYQKILEYVSLQNNQNVFEAGEPPVPDNGAEPTPDMGGAPVPDMGGAPTPDAGGAPDMGGAPVPDDGAAAPDMGPGQDTGGVEGFEPQGEDTPDLGVDDSEEDEEVIDVDELTDSQEDTEKKVEKMAGKFERLFKALEKFEKKLDANSRNIEMLGNEIEKRNPTPVEKLSLRSKDGYPFNVSVDDYWKEKGMTSDNYSAEDDNDGQDDEIYKITKDDIDSEINWPEISKSLDDSELYMSLKDILGY